MIDFEKIIQSAGKSGKILLGSKKALEAARRGRAVALIIPSDPPRELLEKIEYHAQLSKTPIHIYPSNSADLGTVCGKPFSVSAVSIRSISDPALLRELKKTED